MTSEEPDKAGDPPPEDKSDSRPLDYARPGTKRPSDKLVTIATFGNSWEAHLAAGKLEAAGIPAVLGDENINSIGGGLYGNMVGGIKLQVPEVHAEAALAALPQRVRETRLKCPRCGSVDTRQIDFTPGIKILFLCMLGIPYLFAQKPWYCLGCSYAWKPTPEELRPKLVFKDEGDDDDDEDDEPGDERRSGE